MPGRNVLSGVLLGITAPLLLGGTRLLGMLLTMDDRQGVEVVRLIRPQRTVPVHFDDYRVSSRR